MAAAKKAAAKKAAGKGSAAAPAQPRPLSVEQRIGTYGVDRLMQGMADGTTMTALAAEIGVSIGMLCTWVAADPERSARAREARIHAARVWDEKALITLESACDPFELARAKEMAQHYRWRASKTAPRDYGDKLELDGKLQHDHHHTMNPEQARRMAAMLLKDAPEGP